ncbi:hypothetical protein EDD85DRAFT_943463 [Armillaria nabsnona]|nr:hypothetical protein EDD85DRAFT_943463 [Armillaria nabsnona]
MTEIVHRVHIHCFTPPPPQHLRIGVTGVVCTSSYISERVLPESVLLGIVPASVYGALEQKQLMLPFSHLWMMPWTAEFVSEDYG